MPSQKGSKTTAAKAATPEPTPAELRRAARAQALASAVAVVSGLEGEDETTDVAEALRAMVTAFSPSAREPGAPRVKLEKAEPTDVASYFASTGLTRKELAAAAQVTPSVIATVQNEKGDRWSAKTFAAKKAIISQWMADHKAEIESRKAAEAAEAATRKAAADAKAARASGAKPAAKPAAAKAKATAAPAKKPGRPSHSQRQANRRRSAAVAVQA